MMYLDSILKLGAFGAVGHVQETFGTLTKLVFHSVQDGPAIVSILLLAL